jgi:hypothetical protein
MERNPAYDFTNGGVGDLNEVETLPEKPFSLTSNSYLQKEIQKRYSLRLSI